MMDVKAQNTQNYNKYKEEYDIRDKNIMLKKDLMNNLLKSDEFKTLKQKLDKYTKEIK
jgi:hypothetical protein